MPENLTIENYVEGVQNALQFWLDIHTIAEKWAEQWILDNDPSYTFKECPVIKNNYFEFKWKESALRQMAEDDKHLFNVCNGCGCINENGFDCGCEEEGEGEGDEPTTEDLFYWLQELDAQPDDSALLESLEKEGFKIYQEALSSIIAPVVGEVTDVLKAIHDAESREDTLRAVLWGTRVYHVHGNIMQDYSNHVNYDVEIDYKIIDSIRNDGLESVFSREEIEEYLKGE